MKSKKFKVVLVISLLSIVLFCYRYHMVNKDYPEATVEKYDMFQTIHIDGIRYTVTDKGLCDGYDVAGEKVYLVKVLVENISDDTISIDFSDISLRFENNSETVSTIYMEKFNDYGVNYNIEAGEKILVTLPYPLNEDEIPDMNFDNIESYRKELTFSIYPKKIYVKIT